MVMLTGTVTLGGLGGVISLKSRALAPGGGGWPRWQQRTGVPDVDPKLSQPQQVLALGT